MRPHTRRGLALFRSLKFTSYGNEAVLFWIFNTIFSLLCLDLFFPKDPLIWEPLALGLHFFIFFAGDNIQIVRLELKTQSSYVKSLKKRSLWSKTLEEVGNFCCK